MAQSQQGASRKKRVHHCRNLPNAWVSLRKGEVIFSGAKLDIFQWLAWLLLGGFIFLFIYIVYYLFSNLNKLSASNDVQMHFQSDIEERYSSIPNFIIRLFSICLQVINFNFCWWLLDFIAWMSYRKNMKGFPASWELTAASRTSQIIHSNNLSISVLASILQGYWIPLLQNDAKQLFQLRELSHVLCGTIFKRAEPKTN